MDSRLLTRRTCLSSPLALWAAPTLARPREGGRAIVINLSLEPESLDPTMAASASAGEVVHYNVLEGLTRIEENGTVSPLLAESWELHPGGRACTLRLRRGVRFHDGAAFDSAAVRFTFERARAPGSTNKARRGLFDNIRSIDTPDAHTVTLTLRHPDAHLHFRLGEATAVILHPATAAQAATHPVGTGPYQVQQWQRGHGVTLAKAATYRNADAVRIERATFRFVVDPDAQMAALEAGEIDLFFHVAARNANRFLNDTRYQVLIGSSGGKGLLALNQRRKPLDDVRVRRAITHAIDRESFIRNVLEGRGHVIGSHFSPSDAGYVHLAGMYPYDPARARDLLRQAGVATARSPLRLTLALPPAPYARTGGPVVAADLARVGIEVRIKPLTWAEWLEGPFKGDFDMTLINHVEPLDYLIYTDPNYYFGYDSPALRDLVQSHSAAVNARERQMLFAELQRHLAQDAVNAWIFTPRIGTVVHKGLRGTWMNYPIFVHDIASLSWE